MPQRVTLFRAGERPRTGMLALVVEERQLQVISSPAELATGGPPADVVVVEVPAKYRRVACEQLRRHYRGRLIVLLDPGDSSHDLPPDPNRTLLTHPFGIHELSAALTGSVPIEPTGGPRLLSSRRAQVRGADSRSGTGHSMVAEVGPWLAQCWRERRLVRASTISVTVALLCMVAFVLVTQGVGCGSACQELTDANLTTVTAVAADQGTTDSSAGIVGPTTTDSIASPAAAGGNQADAATSSRPGIARTTAGSDGAPSPTSPPDPTLPSSTAPPTTAPPTTAPTTSTATTTTAPPHPTPPPHPTKP